MELVCAAEEGLSVAELEKILWQNPQWCRVREDCIERSLDHLALNSRVFNSGLAWKKL